MHKAKAVLLTCIDFRFHKYVQKWLEDNNYLGHIDEVSVAGATRDLVKPLESFHKDALMRQFEISVKLHQPDEIILLDHQDCGGYAMDGTIPSAQEVEADKQQHVQYAAEAKKLMEEKFPGILVTSKYIDLQGNISELL